jgi:hypothetical protein
VVLEDGVCEEGVERRLLLLSGREERGSKDDEGEQGGKRQASTRRPARARHCEG